MDSMALYRILQQSVSSLNHITVRLYKGEIVAEEAEAAAKEEAQRLNDRLNKKE